MDRRSFLRGLLALPFAPLAVKVVQRAEPYFPWMGPWVQGGTWKMTRSSYLGGGKFPVGTIDHYKAPPNVNIYGEIEGLRYVRTPTSIRYIRTGASD